MLVEEMTQLIGSDTSDLEIYFEGKTYGGGWSGRKENGVLFFAQHNLFRVFGHHQGIKFAQSLIFKLCEQTLINC